MFVRIFVTQIERTANVTRLLNAATLAGMTTFFSSNLSTSMDLFAVHPVKVLDGKIRMSASPHCSGLSRPDPTARALERS